MPVYEITGVAEAVRDWNSPLGGQMRGYRIDLKGADGSEELLVEWSRKVASPAPTVGMQVEGVVKQGQYGKKFKKSQAISGSGGGRFEEDPKRSARIQRMHSQDMAMRAMALRLTPEELHDMPAEKFSSALSALADWFDKDADGASDRA
jgi:hypothetical protein